MVHVFNCCLRSRPLLVSRILVYLLCDINFLRRINHFLCSVIAFQSLFAMQESQINCSPRESKFAITDKVQSVTDKVCVINTLLPDVHDWLIFALIKCLTDIIRLPRSVTDITSAF